MTDYSRYAIYYLPADGALAAFGASWLGWDVLKGQNAEHFPIQGLADLTQTAAKYGFHGTLKPPFRLAVGTNADALHQATSTLATRLAPARLDALELGALHGFLALVPRGPVQDLATIASACVTELDTFRAPAGAEELARRRSAGLTPSQDALLLEWGYPYVLHEFRFHMTLTKRLDQESLKRIEVEAQDRLPALQQPYIIDAIALAGERPDKRFELIERFSLSG